MRVILHYLAMMVVIPFYGIQVCPFIERLEPLEIIFTIDGLLLLTLIARKFIHARFIPRTPLVSQAWRVFNLDFSTFLSAGIILSAYNIIVYDFPIESGFKVLVGIMAMGLFASTDFALEKERENANKARNEQLVIQISGDFFPLTSKLALFAGAYVLLMVGVFSLLVIKDLDWLVSVGTVIPLQEARISILKEFGFVLLVVLVISTNIIMSFTRNLKMFMNLENGVLEKVTSGQYDCLVPVSSNDEFGIMATHTNKMIERICERTRELNLTRDVTILTLASLAETRDNETGAHILRTQHYVRALAKQLQNHPRFSSSLDPFTIDLLYKSAPLHDIGKVGIPDTILLKPGKLTDEEFEIMKEHAAIGAEALKVAEVELGSNSFLRFAQEISLTHHEKWDGSGYPKGLSGDEIPVSGRLMAVADVYDALISKRVYKPAFSHEKAMEIIREGSGQHFDPDIVEALNEIEEEFKVIATTYSDKRYETAENV